MHRFSVACAILLLVSVAIAQTENAAKNELQEEYYAALAQYFEMELDRVSALTDSGIADEELPVVLTVARRTSLSLSTLVALRAQGDSWKDIFRVRSIDPGIFFMLMAGKIQSETYSPIFSMYNENAPETWKKLEWKDSDFVNMANLRFISSQHDYSVFEVISLRDQKHDFLQINHDVRLAKAKFIQESKKRRADSIRTAEEKEGE